ncbi:hypothetical protein DL96DRAFT_1528423 [Flagelloscypha sp. PMI_526]|nr:hypothetical protein DL96DRAFT_1528423 [Flagelloscypha sp. PMI_526]
MIWEAGRATTAAPGLFSPISIGPEYIGETFVSGEFGWNNPMDQLTEEAALAFKDRHISCIINIGSGHPGHLTLSNGLSDLFSRIALDCERVAERMERRFGEVPHLYKRLSVEQGMQKLDVKLVNLHEVVAHTQSYLQGSRVARNIDSLLRDLSLRPKRIRVHMISGVVPSIAEAIKPNPCPQPTPYFTGRRSELQTMQKYFSSASDSCRVCVLYGMGASGKTQIALKFIQQNQNRFSEIFFVDASDKLTLETNLKAIAGPSSDKPSVDDALRLLRTTRDDWLLFLDNADDIKLDLRPYISWAHGNVIITTRNREARAHAPKCSIWVDRLELEDAIQLLLGGVDVPQGLDTHDIAVKIVNELGSLALAINQTRAFLAKGMCALDEYLSIYAQNRKKLLDDKSIQTTDDYAYTVYTTWTISFNKLSPDAALLLQLLCYMHHESIPCRLFKDAWDAWQAAEHEKEAASPPSIAAFVTSLFAFRRKEQEAVPRTVATFLSTFTAIDLSWDILRFRNLIGEILSFSLLEFNTLNHSVSLHPLVQQWAQHHSHNHQEIVHASQTLLSLATPTGRSQQDYTMMMSLLPHLRESTKAGVELHYTLLPRVGKAYRHGGLFPESRTICQRALSETQQKLGPEHPQTLMCMSELAFSYIDLGEYQESLKLNEEVLQLQKRVLGYKHPNTLETMSNLALSHQGLGQYQDALKFSEEAFELRKWVLGYDHPDTLNTMNNLALSHSNLGQYQDALKVYEEQLKLINRTLGDEHPDAIIAMGNLAITHANLGQYQKALNLEKGVLRLRKQALGNHHPLTLLAMNNLSATQLNLGQYQEALKLNEDALELMKNTLGLEHSNTLTGMNNLGQIYAHLGRYQDSLKLAEEAAELAKRVMGNDHPLTLGVMGNFANAYSYLGQYQNALTLAQEVLELRKRAVGEEHPDILMPMNNVAQIYSGLGQDQDALNFSERVLELAKRIHGHDHPDTLTFMLNVARNHLDLGQYVDALKLNEEALELSNRIMGREHPQTLTTMKDLALSHSRLGHNEEALKLYEETLELMTRILGYDHPDTLEAMNCLAGCKSNLGQHQDALKLNEEVLELRRRVLGHDHPGTLLSMSDLAQYQSNLGQYQDALKLNEEVLELRQRVLGQDHPATLTSMSALAFSYSNLGQHKDALKLSMDVLELRQSVLGPEHPDTIASSKQVEKFQEQIGCNEVTVTAES